MKIYHKIPFLILTAATVLFQSCKKMIQVPTPQNQLTTDKVFADSTSATAAMVNIYSLFDNTIDPSYNTYLSCYSDELKYTGSTQEITDYAKSAVAPSNAADLTYWTNSYFVIYSCNSLIENVQKATRLPKTMVAQFISEAKFLRAFTYYYLINTYGAVPLVLTTDVNSNARAAQADSAAVYQQIIQDLKDAQDGLTTAYPSGGRVRANKYAAAAMLARAYLWQKNWAGAEAAATSVIGSGLYTPLPVTTAAFTANSQETILAFWTHFGYIYNGPDLIPSSGPPQYFFSADQVDAFEAGDLRKADWVLQTTIGTDVWYSPYKYHNSSDNTTAPEYLIALRAGEQYLIRAQARAQQNNVTGAINDLNTVRQRAGLAGYSGATDKSTLLAAILHERRVELFTEWGNRYLDLKRTGTLNGTIGPLKPTWRPTAAVLPVPQYELNTNQNLKQNPGY
jgi:hypothetical protein